MFKANILTKLKLLCKGAKRMTHKENGIKVVYYVLDDCMYYTKIVNCNR